ncbi:MAG: hypothetical protein WBG71_03880 [Leeuwenhoekiella sp.]
MNVNLTSKSVTDVIIIIALLFFIEFFSLKTLEDSSMISAGVFGFGVLFLITTIIAILYKTGYRLHLLDKLVLYYVIAIFLSLLAVYNYWDQSLISSFLAYRDFYIFFLYFVLIATNATQERVERIFIILFFLSLFIFFVDYLTFPDSIFANRSEERREGITIYFYGTGFTFLGAFYYLNKFFRKWNFFYLLWFGLAFVCLFFLTQSRMNLIALVLGFFLLLVDSDFRYKWSLVVAGMIGALVFYNTSAAFDGIKEENQAQAKYYKDDIRVQSQEFYLTELQGGIGTVIFGNGHPSGGSRLENATFKGMKKGYFTSDVGITGIFSYFGLMGVVFWGIIFPIAFFTKYGQDLQYIRAYFLTIFTTVLTGYSLFEPGYMPVTVLALYLLRCNIIQKSSSNSLLTDNKECLC